MDAELDETSDIVTRFLDALRTIKPEAGYLLVEDGWRLEEDGREAEAIGLDGWAYRLDLQRMLQEFVASEKEERPDSALSLD